MAEILYGIRESDGKILSIFDILSLPNPDIMQGHRCGCLCPNPNCRKPLLAKLGKGVENGGREPHFSHFPNFDGSCSSTHANETALHMMAKEIIAEELVFVAPNEEIAWEDTGINDIPTKALADVPIYIHPIGGTFKCSHVVLEKRLHGIIPDVVAYTSLGEYLIEISVTHPVPVEKKLKTAALQLPMLEIDLSDQKGKPITKESLRDVLLNPSNRARWIYYKNKEHILLEAENYYRNHDIVSAYMERESNLQRVYEENYAKARTRKLTYYNPQYYRKNKSKSGEIVVDASNMKEYLKKGLEFYRQKKDLDKIKD